MIRYRPEIDGLRAISVASIIMFHAGFNTFKGGYVGVDIFFVISGYLITLILLDEIDNDRFSLWSFYERRVRRILPALIVVMLLCIPPVWLILLPHQIKDFGQSLVATSLFSANILFWLESGYFEPSSELKPLLHTWSLSVEEQFYIIFPALLVLLIRFRHSIVLMFFLFLAILSYLYGDFLYLEDPYGKFYLIPTRAWQLVAGVICALLLAQSKVKPNVVLAGVGLAMIVASTLYLDRNTVFPGPASIIPIIGAGLVILHTSPSCAITKILSFKPFVWLGLISFSAYLVHHPLFAFTRAYLNSEPSIGVKIFLIVAIIFVATVLYKFIESPFRNKKKFLNISYTLRS